MERKPLLFFSSFSSKDVHWGIILVWGGSSVIHWLPLTTTALLKLPRMCVWYFCTRGDDDPVFMGSTLTEMCHKVYMKQSVNKEITVLMKLFKMPAVMLCILHWLLPHRNLPQPSFILPHNPQHAMCRTLQHCNSWWLSQLACVADISRLSTSVSSPIP